MSHYHTLSLSLTFDLSPSLASWVLSTFIFMFNMDGAFMISDNEQTTISYNIVTTVCITGLI